jgi:[protein-PII] uridylyltransferase
VAGEAGSVEAVSLLRALTEADSLATGPSAWSPWKAGLLDTLVARTIEMLEGGGDVAGGDDEFPTSAQLELLGRSATGLLADGDRIAVVAEDRPGVFFRVAGALAIHGLDVVEARIHSEGDYVLDEFRVRTGPSGMVPWDRVRDDVVKVLEGRLALQVRVEERARSHTRRQHGEVHQFPPSVKFDNGGSAAGSVVEVVGPNSIGLLYRLARALSEFNLNITGARIHTMGPDVVDAFYVSLPNGGRLEDEELQSEVRRALLNALDPLD